jgi:hypothetical protein
LALSRVLIKSNHHHAWDEYDPAKVEDDAASATEEEDWEDNERSERCSGYDPDRTVDPWAEYQAVMEDPMLAY